MGKSHTLEFTNLIEYDAGLPGISFEVGISVLGSATKLTAKVDTGSTDCIFARKHGVALGLNIEERVRVEICTATGSFSTYRHFVTLTFLDFSYSAGICFAAEAGVDRNILGRSWFLNQILLGLNDYDGKLYISGLQDI